MNKRQAYEMFPIGDPLGRRILFDPVTAITGGLGLAGSVASGLIGSSAAKSAAKAQAEAAAKAGAQIVNTTNSVNPQIGNSAATAGQMVSGAAGEGADAIQVAGDKAAQGVASATGTANDLLQPYIGAGQQTVGQLQEALKTGGALNHTFDASNMEANDPGYAFRLQQAQQAMQNSQAAHGSALGGNAALAMDRYTQDYASGEFGNAWNRDQQQQQGLFNRLNTVAGMGLGAAGTAGTNDINSGIYGGNAAMSTTNSANNLRVGAAQYVGDMGYDASKTQASNSINASRAAGDYLTQGANATASGTVGAANAWGSAIGGGLTNAGNMVMLSKLMKNPARPTYSTSSTDWNLGG